MKRKEAIETIINSLKGNEAVISSTGLISRQMFELDDSARHFFMTGSLGLASSIGLGVAICQPERKVLVVEGDAALLLNLGSLATIGSLAPKNLTHVVLDNQAYGSCSGEPSFSATSPLEQLAALTGYRTCERVSQKEDLARVLEIFSSGAGPGFILAEIELGERRDFPRPLNLPEIQKRFKDYLSNREKCVSDNQDTKEDKHAPGSEKLVEEMRCLLKRISLMRIENFSGLGVVLYKSDVLSELTHFNTRPSVRCPKGLKIREEDCFEFLSQLTRNSADLHDGFVFVNQDGELTHVAQYFVPPVVLDIEPNGQRGIRYHSAQFGSCLDGVIATGIVGSDQTACYFIKGTAYFFD